MSAEQPLVFEKGRVAPVNGAGLKLSYLGWEDQTPGRKSCKQYVLYILAERGSCAPTELRFELTMRGNALKEIDGSGGSELSFYGAGDMKIVFTLVEATPSKLVLRRVQAPP